jgi:hypothetical protein
VNGTKIGLYDYGNSPDAAVTRQWMFVKAPALTLAGSGAGIDNVADNPDAVRVIGGIGVILLFQVAGYAKKISIYNIAGGKVKDENVYGSSASIPMAKGIYLVRYLVDGYQKPKTVKVLVR